MDGSPTARSLSVGDRTTLSAAGPRPHLWASLRGAGERDGHQTSAVSTPLALAARLCRARDWHDPARVPGPRHRVQRAKSPPAFARFPGLLSSEPHALEL